MDTERMRAWWAEDPMDREPLPGDADVRCLAGEIAPGSPVRDLGGCTSLNLALDTAGLVLRIQPPFVSRTRIERLREVRRRLAARGLIVAEPRTWKGREVLRCRGRWAELEAFVPHEKPEATWASYTWMFRAMGTLHRALAGVDVPVPRPVISTYGPPSSLLRWMPVTENAVSGDPEVTRLTRLARSLLPALRRQWVPGSALPKQLIHGDVRLGNVGLTAAAKTVYLDFGFAAVRPRIHELAYSLAWMILRPDGLGRAEDFAWKRVPDLVGEYEEAARTTLVPAERGALAPYLAAVPLYHASIIGHADDPVGRIRDDRDAEAFLRISEWVLANRRAVLET